MFGRRLITGSTESYSEKIQRLKSALRDSDAVVIGAGAGLSASAGFVYGGGRFRQYFSDYEKAYGFHDMYSGGFYPYDTPEEMWAFWSRLIYVNRYMDAPKPVYRNLFKLVEGRDYFVITTNVDHCFQKAGFDGTRLFYTQGDYGLFQCSVPCCDETFDNEETVRKMVETQKDMRIPSELIPYCPHCSKPLAMNLRSDDTFVEDRFWHDAASRYENFLNAHTGSILFLELGVGYNTPVIIKYPFWKMTAQNPDAVYASVNLGEAVCPEDIAVRSICLDADIGQVIDDCLA